VCNSNMQQYFVVDYDIPLCIIVMFIKSAATRALATNHTYKLQFIHIETTFWINKLACNMLNFIFVLHEFICHLFLIWNKSWSAKLINPEAWYMQGIRCNTMIVKYFIISEAWDEMIYTLYCGFSSKWFFDNGSDAYYNINRKV